jgi:lipopolysaccharide/colanic/teichoic acid biosynthesis glycosyltransferase
VVLASLRCVVYVKTKTCFDLVLGVAALILFSPMMVLMGWLIKIASDKRRHR